MIVLGTATLVGLFYVEEDWRGARNWKATKAEWEARGETLAWSSLVPPPAPADQNLAAIPLFKLEPSPSTGGALDPLALDRAMRQDLPGGNLPPLGSWRQGKLPDVAKLKATVAEDYAAAFHTAKPPTDSLAQCEALYPFLADLRAAAATRPSFRLNGDYLLPPVLRSFGPIVAGLRLTRILTIHAILALDHHEPDVAFEDIRTDHILLSGIQRDPSLVGGLVAVGMQAMNQIALEEGLIRHAWTDSQLAELEQMFGSLDLLAVYQFDLRSQVASSAAKFDFYAGRPTHLLLQISDGHLPVMIRFAPPWPTGWWNENKNELATFLFRELAVVDPPSHRVFPEVEIRLGQDLERASRRWDAQAPWNILFILSAPPIARSSKNFAEAQAWNDETRIAFALERYWLAHRAYPTSLDALMPGYIDKLPYDIMNGQPYHYRLRPDGTFLLYSVGWNERDDGGRVMREEDRAHSINYDEGDWVWPTPK